MKHKLNGATIPQKLLVISDQSGFSRDLVARWQMQPRVPEFTALSSELMRDSISSSFDVVVAGDIRPERAYEVLSNLNRGAALSVYVTGVGESVHAIRRDYARVIAISRHDAWLDTLVLVAEEVLKRAEAASQIERLEQSARASLKQATLGNYMVEMRHSFNNALTSVLGNAELLMLESGALSSGMREQLETLHSMTLRMHEMMQRFTSLELELQCAERVAGSAKSTNSVLFKAQAQHG